MEENMLKIERIDGEFPGEANYIYIYFGVNCVRVEIPVGHSSKDVSVDISQGEGWVDHTTI